MTRPVPFRGQDLLLAQLENWLCVMDRHGNVTAFHPACTPTVGTP
jgi:hypothetical protein